MAYTQVTLPSDTWVEVQAGEAEGLFIPSTVGNIRLRTETSAPSAGDETGLPTVAEVGNNFVIEAGTSLYARSIGRDTIGYLNIKD